MPAAPAPTMHISVSNRVKGSDALRSLITSLPLTTKLAHPVRVTTLPGKLYHFDQAKHNSQMHLAENVKSFFSLKSSGHLDKAIEHSLLAAFFKLYFKLIAFFFDNFAIAKFGMKDAHA